VAGVLRLLRGQGAHVAGPHLVAGRPRGGAHRGLGDPGRRALEDGRLWLPQVLPAHDARRLGLLHAAGVFPLGRRGDLHLPGGAGPRGYEEADRLLLGGPHGPTWVSSPPAASP
jgi:hypothetical protein